PPRKRRPMLHDMNMGPRFREGDELPVEPADGAVARSVFCRQTSAPPFATLPVVWQYSNLEGRSMLKLRDIMTRDVTTLSPDLPLRDAMELLVSEHLSGAPVVSDGKLVGVISASDLLSSIDRRCIEGGRLHAARRHPPYPGSGRWRALGY